METTYGLLTAPATCLGREVAPVGTPVVLKDDSRPELIIVQDFTGKGLVVSASTLRYPIPEAEAQAAYKQLTEGKFLKEREEYNAHLLKQVKVPTGKAVIAQAKPKKSKTLKQK